MLKLVQCVKGKGDIELLDQLASTRLGETVMQGREQDDDHPEVDLAPGEAGRCRGIASPATVLRTAEAQTALVVGIQG